MTCGIHAQKRDLRRVLKEERQRIGAEERETCSALICRRFLSLAVYRYAEILLLYAALPGEPDVFPIARRAWEDGKRVAFPRCLTGDGVMRFHFVSGEDELMPGMFGIREPAAEAEAYEPADGARTVCVVPGLAFDRRGNRLGSGGGYYDRYLASFRGTVAGVCMQRFVRDAIPRGRYDRPADILITERGVTAVYEKKQG